MNRSSAHRQGGYALLEVLMASLLAATLISQIFVFMADQAARDGARAAGVRVAQYNAAVAAFINGNQPNVPVGNFVGVDWLKRAGGGCAGATGTEDWLPCNFTDDLPFSLQYDTTIVRAGAAPPFTYTATTTLGAPITGRGIDRVVAGELVLAAEAFVGIARLQAERVVGYTSYDLDPPTGIVTALVNTATTADAWLRRDGTNAMAAHLNAGGFDVTNARDVNAGRNVTANTAGAGGDVTIDHTDDGTGQSMSLAGALQGAEIVTTGPLSDAAGAYAVVTKPDCPDGLTEKIEAVAVRVSDGGWAVPIGSLRTWAKDDGAQWRVYASIETARDQTEHSPMENRIAVKRYCQPS